MRRILLSATALILAISVAPLRAADGIPDYVAAAVADKDRPKEDTDRDASRHPAEIMALTGVKPGDRAVDVGPGRASYYTKILSRIVGQAGKVYMFNSTATVAKFPQVKDAPAALASAGYSNVEGVILPMDEIKFDQPVDVVFMSQIYHDQVWLKVDTAKMNKAIFDALKPGGVYFIIDHIGPGVTTPDDIGKVHRIDPALVKDQVLAAGFKLDAESDILRNPNDPKNVLVFDASIRGKTDQLVFKFRKPAK